jgi:starch synthase
MKVLHVASECSPFVKVGGLGDVVGALPKALLKIGVDVAVAIPFYQKIKSGVAINGQTIAFDRDFDQFEVEFDFKIHRVFVTKTILPGSGVPVYLFECENYLSDGPYDSPDAVGRGFGEELRFSFFCAAVAAWPKVREFDVLHCHDKHASLLTKEAKIKGLPAKVVLTIHNLANKGLPETGLSVGIKWADVITTVSPQYAKEIQTTEFGCGFEKQFQDRAVKGELVGVLNGLDLDFWNPATDPLIESKLSGIDQVVTFKEANKKAIFEKFKLGHELSCPLFALVSRLTEQKGIDLLVSAWTEFAKKNCGCLVVQGQGDPKLVEILQKMAEETQKGGKICAGYYGDFDEKTAHQLYAGADFFLVPSRFEPCGLTQMSSMRYGTVPIVRDVGGLHDTVIDGETGIVFEKADSVELLGALNRAAELYKGENYGKMRELIMAADWSWDKSASQYKGIYTNLLNV